ncbi:hypothetical protein [Agrococcus jejuensis]|uniref:DUF1918 domain-containing protein n=1 Tax=Agrococcus jejuensis TaxID=399736 RepID=A0A1G8DRZ6_9MICO|nr:hypothetical protein [Agrococcus jejuensis]SDH60412.1 hypothetical protein SAMN04489720_1753 [Agrococcus jejuensis]
MATHDLSIGARVRSTIDLGGIVRPFIQAGEPGRIEALDDEGGYVVRFDACHRSMGVHADEVARAEEPARR